MNCKICFGEHEQEIHSATLRVREWFRDEVLKSFEVEEELELQEGTERIPAPAVA